MAAEIIGREQELAKVDAFIDAAGRAPRGLVLEGEAGIGKSTLWREGVEHARARGVRVLTSRPAEGPRAGGRRARRPPPAARAGVRAARGCWRRRRYVAPPGVAATPWTCF